MLQGGVKHVVRESFELIKPNSSRFTRVFYDRLFELQPEIKKNFSRDLRDQRKRFFKTLEFIVGHIDEPGLVLGKISKVRFWPNIYNAKSNGRYIFFSTLNYTLSAALGNNFTPYVRHCWVEFFSCLDQIIKNQDEYEMIGKKELAKRKKKAASQATALTEHA